MIQLSSILIVIAMAGALPGAAPAGNGGKQSSRLEGRVTDLFGMALPQSELLLVHTAGKPARKTLADSNGDFSFSRLAAGSYRLQASLPGFEPRTLEVELETRQVRRFDLGLHVVQLTDGPRCQVTGRVVREGDDQPLPGALVKAIAAFDKDLEFSTVAGRDGRFSLEIGRTAQYLVFAHSPGFIAHSKELVCQAGPQATLTFILRPLGTP